LYKAIIPIIYNKADILFSNSIYINKDLIANFRLKIPSYVIYNPVNVSQNYPIERNEEILNIIHVGSMSLIKNQKLILRALSICRKPYTMIFLGDGTMMNALRSMTEQLNLDKVNFFGRTSNVNSFLIKNECFILSSNSEGFPNVILEAMAQGLVIISTNCMSGPLEILNENMDVSIPQNSFVVVKYGILVNVNDEVGLCAAIEYVAMNKKFREQMSIKSFERAKDYNTERIVSEISKIIEL
jgi:N-acetylgalactosamine-N,N'-diacetylbacillosaminyl-diphospho-undecaprenol 4-alpha-N-acetylgalactosaminyltransferase